jgi:hypothetical protein
LVLALLVASCGDGGDDGAEKRPDVKASTATAVAVTNLDAAGATRIGILGDWLAAGEGGVWLSAASAVHRLDPGSGRRTA